MDCISAIVADDTQTSRDIVAQALRTLGIRDIRQAPDGGTAFTMICQRPPSFIFLDLEMPHDGYTTMRHIRHSASSPNRALPVIVMSVFAERANVLRIRDAGADEIISKPLSITKICSRVASVLERPRKFIDTLGYTGPDRRRISSQHYNGPLRRTSDHDIFVMEEEHDAKLSRVVNTYRMR